MVHPQTCIGNTWHGMRHALQTATQLRSWVHRSWVLRFLVLGRRFLVDLLQHPGQPFGVRTRDGMTFCDPVPSQTTHSARLALTCKQICMQSTQVPKRNWSWQMHGGSTCSSNIWTARSIGISGIVRGSLGLTY